MNLEYLMKDYANFNLWANKQIVEWLLSSPEDLFEKSMQTGFSTLKKTLLHLWETDSFWLAILQNKPVCRLVECDTKEVIAGLIGKSDEFAAFVNTLNDSQLTTYCKIDTPWITDVRPVCEIIHHCMNHSTYHRGQIVIMAQSQGMNKVPVLDFNHYMSCQSKGNPKNSTSRIKFKLEND